MNPIAREIFGEVINSIAIPLAIAVGNGINQEYEYALETINSAADMTDMERLKARETANVCYWACVFFIPGAFTAPISRYLPSSYFDNNATEGHDEKLSVLIFAEKMESAVKKACHNYNIAVE